MGVTVSDNWTTRCRQPGNDNWIYEMEAIARGGTRGRYEPSVGLGAVRPQTGSATQGVSRSTVGFRRAFLRRLRLSGQLSSFPVREKLLTRSSNVLCGVADGTRLHASMETFQRRSWRNWGLVIISILLVNNVLPWFLRVMLSRPLLRSSAMVLDFW